MASQITHIVYGKKIFDRMADSNWHDFVIGTVFPDIRYLAKLDRNSTHIFHTKEINIPKKNSFKAGFYTHCFVDEKREEILQSLGMYKLIPHDYLHATAIKMLEDYFNFPLFADWKSIITILEDTLSEEESYGVDKVTVKSWHAGIQQYINVGPTEASWESVLVDIIPEVTAKQIAKKAWELKQDQSICDILKKVYSLI